MAGPIYFDNNATTQPLPEVVEAMVPFLKEAYANPSSVHQFGQSVRHRLECAREQVAQLIGASPKELLFTSGGTESINLAIRGVLCMRPHCRHVVTTAVEHAATLRVMERLEEEGYRVDYVGVNQDGQLDEAEWSDKLTDQTALATLLHANNETGVVFDVPRLAAMAAQRSIPVHVDAVQAIGKLPVDVTSWPVQLVSLSAHKFHGPKGIGALYVRRRTHLSPLIIGGGQERQLRGGTENVAGIIGMGVAAETVMRKGVDAAKRVTALRDSLESGIMSHVPFAHIIAKSAPRVGNTSNTAFENLEAEPILILLSEAGICASSGSACSSGSLEPSHVLAAMGIEQRIAHGSVRFSLSCFNTQDEVDRVVSMLPGILSKLTALSRNV